MSEPSQRNIFYNHFPTPEYLTLSTSGIAITDDSVHFIQLRHSLFGAGPKLSRYEKIPLPSGTVEAGFINDTAKLTQILAGLSERYGVKFTRAALPEERAYVFTAEIDAVPPEGLRDAVAFILEENAPVTLANSVFDFDVLSHSEEAGKIKVAVSVISKKVVDFYLQVFEAAGITPVSFDIESQAIARAAVPKGDRSTQLILNLGKKKTGFYVVEDEVVQFTTTLPYGSSGAGRTHLADIRAEIRKIFAFWASRDQGRGERKIGKILLCGQASLDQVFVKELLAEVAEPYDWANPWKNAPSAGAKVPPELVKDALEYACAIGLAIPHPHRTYV